jgi:16S rRNA (uracil1498-N3)-methyltransferase
VTVPESPGPQLVLAVSMPSAARAVRLIEQAVELGVTRLIPLHTARTVPPARGFSLEKVQDSIVSASRLSGRSRLMKVDSQMSWSQFLTSKLMGPGTIVAHPGGAPLNEALPQAVNAAASAGSPDNGKRILTIDEIIAAVTHGARLVDLGPRPLRTDTAALVIASAFMTGSIQTA